jgi:syntaxin-binding protein 1
MEVALDDVVSRLASLFVSLRETPSIRFRAQAGRAAPDDEDGRMREMLAGRLAGELAARMGRLQEKLPDLPAGESCDLLILDRATDAVAPIVHDWSYECLCHDLLRMKGNLYRYRYTANNGKTEEKDVLLDESDPLFRELRSAHLADVMTHLAERAASFTETNKAAGRKKGPELDVTSMKKVVESLPQYREQLQKLSVHSTVSEELNSAIKARSLNAVGTMEQQLIFGDSTSKELIKLLDTLRPATSGSRAGALQVEAAGADRLRLLLCYFGTHAEKLDGPAGVEKWKAAAALQPGDMGAVLNLELLGCAVLKKPAGAPKVKKIRRKAPPNEEGWDLPKFTPRVAELLAELGRGDLSQEAFPYMSPPTDAGGARGSGKSARAAGTSVRSVRPGANPTWASKRGAGADGLTQPGTPPRTSRRLIIFVIGPISYNEIRAAHEAAAALGRDVIIGGTSVASPDEYLNRLRGLRSARDEQ